MRILLELTPHELSVLRDALNTAETQYRYFSRSMGQAAIFNADSIKELYGKLVEAEQTSRQEVWND